MSPHTSCISTGSFYSNKQKQQQRNKLNGGNSASLNTLTNLNREDKRTSNFNTPPRKNGFTSSSSSSYERRSPQSSKFIRRSPYNRSSMKNKYECGSRHNVHSTPSHHSLKKRKLSFDSNRHHAKDLHPMKKIRSNSEEDYRKYHSSLCLPKNDHRQFSDSTINDKQKQFNSSSSSTTSLSRNPFHTTNSNHHSPNDSQSESVSTLFTTRNERSAFRTSKPVTLEEVRNEDKENSGLETRNHCDQLVSNSSSSSVNYFPSDRVARRSEQTNNLEASTLSNCDRFDHSSNYHYSAFNSRNYYRGCRMTNDENNTSYGQQSNQDNLSNSLSNVNAHKIDSQYPVALRNLGNTCYMNSIIQPLFNLPFLMGELRDSMERANLHNSHINFSMTKALVDLFEEYKRMRKTQSTNDEELEKRLCDFKYNVGQHSAEFKSSGQHDAVEFLDSVINSIDEEFDKVKKLIPNCMNPVNKVFKIELAEASHCEACNLKSNMVKNKSHCLILSLPDEKYMEENNQWDLQHILRNSFKPEKRESTCEKCGNKERNRHLSVFKSPRVLILQLGRYTSLGEKRHEPIKVPFEIKLPKVISRSDSERFHDNEFELSGVICHHGSCMAGGHYICYVHDRMNNEWYHCDDENILQTNFERVQEGSKSSGYCFFYLNRKYV